jgi:hypothetical protein
VTLSPLTRAEPVARGELGTQEGERLAVRLGFWSSAVIVSVRWPTDRVPST